MNDIVATIRRMNDNTASLVRYKKWHPQPRPLPKCEHCDKEFGPKGYMTKNGMQVVLSGENRRQIHYNNHTHDGKPGMCLMTDHERRHYWQAWDAAHGKA